MLVGIAPAGLTLLDDITDPLRACHQAQLGHLPAADLAALTALLKRVRAPHEPDGSPWK